jgi:hypothetical protein
VQLFNAAKYTSSIPALLLTALQQHPSATASTTRLWLLVSVVNSAFCYYWDVEQDWGMPWFMARHTKQHMMSHQGMVATVQDKQCLLANQVKRHMWNRCVAPASIE